MRESFDRIGSFDGYQPHQVLEMLLFYVNRRGDTNELAHSLINELGGFRNVMNASYDQLRQVPGVGEKTAFYLRQIGASYSYYGRQISEEQKRVVIDSSAKAGDFFLGRFGGRSTERVYALMLDDRRRVIQCADISSGTVNAAPVTARTVVEKAVATAATGVILAHNHPGGDARPSPEDLAVTGKIFRALQMISVELADHIIVAGDRYVSLADLGAVHG